MLRRLEMQERKKMEDASKKALEAQLAYSEAKTSLSEIQSACDAKMQMLDTLYPPDEEGINQEKVISKEIPVVEVDGEKIPVAGDI